MFGQHDQHQIVGVSWGKPIDRLRGRGSAIAGSVHQLDAGGLELLEALASGAAPGAQRPEGAAPGG